MSGEATWQYEFDTADILELLVETDPAGANEVPNLIYNHGGEPIHPDVIATASGHGWVPSTGAGGRITRRTTVGIPLWFIEWKAQSTGVGLFVTPPLYINPGDRFYCEWSQVSGATWNRVRITFFDATGATLAIVGPTAAQQTTSTTRSINGTAPSGTSFAIVRWDLGGNSSMGNVTAGTTYRFYSAKAGVKPTGTEAITDTTYTDILNDCGPISVTREVFNTGTLTTTVRGDEYALDTGLIRPGARITLRLKDDLTPLFTGRIAVDGLAQSLDPLAPAGDRTYTTFTAVDAWADLAATPAPNGTPITQNLPGLMGLAAQVPFNFNGVEYAAAAAGWYTTGDTAATLADQLIRTIASHRLPVPAQVRRFNLWVDPAGTVRGDEDDQPTIVVGEDDYSGIVLGWNAGPLINTITITEVFGTPTQSAEYGPFYDQRSRARWGTHAAVYTLMDAAEEATARQLLDLYGGDPEPGATGVVIPLHTLDRVSQFGGLDLFAVLEVTLADPVMTAVPHRVIGIQHEIAADKWLLHVGLQRGLEPPLPTV